MPIEIPDQDYLEYILLKRGAAPTVLPRASFGTRLWHAFANVLFVGVCLAALAAYAVWFGIVPAPAELLSTLAAPPHAVVSTAAPALVMPAARPAQPAYVPQSAPAEEQPAPAIPPPLYAPLAVPAPANVGPSEPADNPGFSAAAEPGCDQACADESARLAAELKYEQQVRALYMPDATPRTANVGPSERTRYDVSQGDVLP